ncbi:MAG: hypothetical protein ACOC44_11230, partial [Promethearchaeia archaeon]
CHIFHRCCRPTARCLPENLSTGGAGVGWCQIQQDPMLEARGRASLFSTVFGTGLQNSDLVKKLLTVVTS